MLVEREAEHRDHKSYLGHLRQAQLRMRADIHDVDCRAGRGIARTTLTQLATGDWIRQALNLIIEGRVRDVGRDGGLGRGLHGGGGPAHVRTGRAEEDARRCATRRRELR